MGQDLRKCIQVMIFKRGMRWEKITGVAKSYEWANMKTFYRKIEKH